MDPIGGANELPSSLFFCFISVIFFRISLDKKFGMDDRKRPSLKKRKRRYLGGVNNKQTNSWVGVFNHKDSTACSDSSAFCNPEL